MAEVGLLATQEDLGFLHARPETTLRAGTQAFFILGGPKAHRTWPNNAPKQFAPDAQPAEEECHILVSDSGHAHTNFANIIMDKGSHLHGLLDMLSSVHELHLCHPSRVSGLLR